uniref:Cordon-bleu WH2 repeat protein n=1 Tax=Capra hircus TaxID=9925 RepID=A0A452FQ01_CAPHI
MDAPRASAAKPPTGRKMKARAPPPPGKPATPNLHGGQRSPRRASPGPPQNQLSRKHSLDDGVVAMTVVLPSGLEKRSVVNGSHAMMDLLVELCLQNHLNPSNHALEIRSSETQQPLNFKPNTLVGTLNVHTVFLKEKVPEAKVKPVPPKVPEKTVRLVVNYLRTQKAVVRVSPEVPLQSILPVICAKCEVSPEHVVLLRDNVAGEELELSKSLNELGIKELYAWDNKRETFRKSSLSNDETDKEKKKFLGFFKVNKRSNSKGCLTTPNSPCVNPRSALLGPSLSLGNISGVSVKSDLKKRRAPPPPILPHAGPPVQDKTSEKIQLQFHMAPGSLDSLDVQMMSLGSQMDLQKKKRRAPAPPPPQPPPPSPLVPPRTEDREEGRKGRTVSLSVGPGGPCSVDGVPPVPSEAEETVSVGSCFASEDTTEDSGVMSSPSDIVSLDSQHDSTKSKDKWGTDQEDCSDQDLAGTPEPGPPRSPQWERSSSENRRRRNGKAAPASHEEEEIFMTGQFQKSLAELDADLEEMEESYEADAGPLASSVHGMSTPHGDTEAIPVTFIGEVLDDPVDSGVFSNRNNNAGSFDLGSTADSKAQPPPCQAECPQQHRQRWAAGPTSPAPSQEPEREVRSALTNTWQEVDPRKMEPTASSASAPHTHHLNGKEEGRVPGSAHSGGTPAPGRVIPQLGKEKASDGKGDVSILLPWHQRGQHPVGSYGLKYGLTTYKIVPPKSEMKCYDRGASLSVGAIKIDELGNLVSPHTHAGRTVVPSSPTLEAETPPIGKVKEFWRSNSVEKHSGRPTEGPKRTPAPTTPTNPQPRESRLRGEPTSPDPQGALPEPQPPHSEDGSALGQGRSWPPAAAARPLQAPAANAAEVLFLRPQRRTSSQYMASAIAKRIGTPTVHSDVGRRQGNTQRACESTAPEPVVAPPVVKDSTTPSPNPGTGVPRDGGESTAGPHAGWQVSCPYRKLSAQDCPSGIHGNSRGSLVTAAQRDQASVGQSCGLSGEQGTRTHRTNSASDPECKSDGSSPSRPRSDDQTSGSTLVNGSRWVPIHSEPPCSPRVSDTNNWAGQEPPQREEKPSSLSTGALEADGKLPASIFGPQKKFRPVVQRPAPKDTSLHSALMAAIHSAGGKDRLRKIPEPGSKGAPKKPSYTEADCERSALLAAIRGHSGTCSLRKVTSSASEELQSLRNAALSAHGPDPLQAEGLGVQSQPPPPAPVAQAPTSSQSASRSSSGPLGNPVDARQALMDAIRSGTGAARLRKHSCLILAKAWREC